MNIVEFLKGQFIYQFTDAMIYAKLMKRGINKESEYDQITEKQMDLVMADLYEALCTLFSQGTGSVKMGEWTKTIGGVVITNSDKESFRKTANVLYEKHGEPIISSGKDRTNAW